ncbi:MAG: type I-E CRISPR-associated protein Cas7/Cse4/CasC [Sutterellaceae bacterium]|nr:type I-E CRISPR-associated protein Cas7/Cse4/CasC [Burkholderiaceae bacterium]MDW8430084.1 type I-E CRISPR-associated protein Cas7/Cse4/CasC [Sutterellaceae bacterium]
MTCFIQLHVITSYPPSNLNRDDLGRPKTALVGGVTRLRISSQSLKRAWRTAASFKQALDGHVGVRTKEMGRKVFEDLTKGGVAESDARAWARKIAGCFGKLRAGDGFDIEQLAHFGPEEQEAIRELVNKLIASKSEPTDEDLRLLRAPVAAADIAMFGRMLAAAPAFNVEAAAQVAHAFTVHRASAEDDYFTAVDDLNRGDEDAGAGHIGEAAFGAGVYYLYVCINRDLLDSNLGGDTSLRNRALAALIEAIAKVSPTGKQASFASRAYASYMLAEKGSQQPRSLSLAFVKPIAGDDVIGQSIRVLNEKLENMDKVYGACADERKFFNAETGEGTLAELIAFAQADCGK